MDNISYHDLRTKIIPVAFVCLFTPITQILIVIGNPDLGIGSFFTNFFSLGSFFAWKIVIFVYLWAFLSLKIPGSKKFKGPTVSSNGYTPIYIANGFQYYVASLLTFFGYYQFINPSICRDIYHDFGSIIQVFNITALILCAWLVQKGRLDPEAKGDPLQDDTSKDSYLYLFYRGVELHPRFIDVDIKQWTNCRVGMMGWALFVVIFALANLELNGFNLGPIVNAFLINVYLAKFFYWETGYFNTLDITLDRAGYYLCWGCLCWVQSFYTFSAYFMVGNPDFKSNSIESIAILIFGMITIVFNYAVDHQKEIFKSSNGKCHIWGRPAKHIDVEYLNHEGKKKKSRLLVSGFWGISRHLNYVFEILLALSWSLPCARYGLLPFVYVIFLTILLIHRTYRDEEKCSSKYGQGWIKYTEKVPYKMIPYIF